MGREEKGARGERQNGKWELEVTEITTL